MKAQQSNQHHNLMKSNLPEATKINLHSSSMTIENIDFIMIPLGFQLPTYKWGAQPQSLQKNRPRPSQLTTKWQDFLQPMISIWPSDSKSNTKKNRICHNSFWTCLEVFFKPWYPSHFVVIIPLKFRDYTKLRPEAGLNWPPSSMWFLHTEFTRLKAPLTSVSSKAVLQRQTQEANKDHLGSFYRYCLVSFIQSTGDDMIMIWSL